MARPWQGVHRPPLRARLSQWPLGQERPVQGQRPSGAGRAPHGARPRPSACLAPALFGQMALNELAPALFGRVAFNEPKWRRHVLSMRPWRSNRNNEIA